MRNCSTGGAGTHGGGPPPAVTATSHSADESEFTERFILSIRDGGSQLQPQLEPAESLETTYSLESKPTRATLAETFSSGDSAPDKDHDGSHSGNEDSQRSRGCGKRLEGDVTDSYSSSAQEGDFLDLAEEARQRRDRASFAGQDRVVGRRTGRKDFDGYSTDGEGTSYSTGEEFINLAHEAKMTNRGDVPSRSPAGGVSPSDMKQYSGESYIYQDENGTTHLEFVDSEEEEQAFSFGTRSREEEQVAEDRAAYSSEQSYEGRLAHHDRQPSYDLGRQVSSEVSSIGHQTAECSKTLNTNLETLHTDLEGVNYIPTMNEEDLMVHDPAFHAHQGYHDHVIGAEGESYPEEDTYNGPSREDSYLYDDDGTRFTCYDGRLYGTHEDGTYTEHLHDQDTGTYTEHSRQLDTGTYTEHSRQLDTGTYTEHSRRLDTETYTEHLREQDTYQDTVTEFTRETLATNDEENTHVMSQLLDSYLSDRSSTESWEEGSFESASRALSRIDSVDDDSSNGGSIEGTQYDSDDEDISYSQHNGTLLGLLKSKLRDFKDFSRISDDEDDGEDEDATNRMPADATKVKKKRRSSMSQRSRRKSKQDMETLIGRIGEIGMDLLNETIDKAHATSKSPRHRKETDQTTRIVSSLRDIFSCGAPSRY